MSNYPLNHAFKTIDGTLNALIKDYLNFEQSTTNKDFINKLVNQNDIKQLEKLIAKRLTFGTAGIRGPMGPGYSQMNDLVIIQTSQGLASYLLELTAVKCRKYGVIIGHDARHNSDRFARLTALAFLQKGIPVYFCDHIIATPIVAYGVRHFKCSAGIVITASHNPKHDNGYKVYWSNGAQILSPHDIRIQNSIVAPENQKPWPKAWDQELLKLPNHDTMPKEFKSLMFRVHGELSKSYFSYIEKLVGERKDQNQSSNICITYTSMHGVGHTYLSRALDIAGFNDVFPVELQKKPDPDFSTVKFPNPEESGALDLAFETAKHANSNLILANDPDADRCAAAIYDSSNDYRKVLNGNEIGALLGWWIWHCQQLEKSENITESSSLNTTGTSQSCMTSGSVTSDSKSGQDRLLSDYCMISTAVSSKFLQTMAEVEGFTFIETLTGFKYMGNTADKLINEENKIVLFAFEEALGYMVDSTILDKDGISAAIQVAQCAAFVSSTYNRSLEQQLDWLYVTYGYHFSINSYFICRDPAKIKEIFSTMQANYPKSFGKEFPITRIRDLYLGFDSGNKDLKPSLPCSTSSFMTTFFVGKEITFTIRTSGTEPKIKYYSEIVAKLPPSSTTKPFDGFDKNQLTARDKAMAKLERFVQEAIKMTLKPEQYDLEAAD